MDHLAMSTNFDDLTATLYHFNTVTTPSIHINIPYCMYYPMTIYIYI